jgi:tRNA(Ile)-lysidine synthase
MREYVDDWMEPERARRLDQAYGSREEGGALGLDALRSMPDVWQRRVILDALARDLPDASQTAATAQEIAALIDAPVGRRVTVVGGTVWRGRTHLRLLPASAVPPRVSGVPVETGQDVSLPRGTLRLDVLDAPPDNLDTGTPLVVYADATRLPQPLVVRTWTDGDRFRPLGMQGSKSVSDFSLAARARVRAARRGAHCVGRGTPARRSGPRHARHEPGVSSPVCTA